MNEKILIVDDEADVLDSLYYLLTEEDRFRVVRALGGQEALRVFASEDFDLVITDLKMPQPDGLEVMRQIREKDGEVEIIVLTGYASVETAVAALRDYNAFDYLNKPLDDIDEMFIVIDRALERKKMRSENRQLVQKLKDYNAQLEKRVEERTEELEKAQVSAELASRAKSDFLSCMSHELRTPLSHVIGFAQIFLSDHPGDDCVETILKSGQHLLSLVDDVISFAKAGSGDMQVGYSAVDLKKLLEQSEMIIREKASEKKIAFSCIKENLPGNIMADEYMLRQILYNLLSNAVKFTPDGGSVIMTARSAENRSPPGVEFIIKDSGIGIAAENLERIFNPFEQLENYLTRKYSGTGLGLSLAKKLAELHRGSVRAESKGKDKGSVFRCFIPLAPFHPNICLEEDTES